jgi:predicted DNA-binding antitoxin AbrB/MazE fold protein
MASLRLRYQKGVLIPLDPLPDLKDGDEIEVDLVPASEHNDIKAMLDQTRGLWADWDGVEESLDEAREKWDEAWRGRLSSL